ncbi:hypothetical protein MJD09_26330 [bacterium]|nr:hypothetical protein [bacterium]
MELSDIAGQSHYISVMGVHFLPSRVMPTKDQRRVWISHVCEYIYFSVVLQVLRPLALDQGDPFIDRFAGFLGKLLMIARA